MAVPTGESPITPLQSWFVADQAYTDAVVAPLIALGTIAVADLNALPAASVGEGKIVHVDDMAANFQSQDGAWVQITTARVVSISAANTAYDKAGGAYKISTALIRVTGELWDRRWNPDGSGAWKPDGSGLLPIKPTSVSGATVVADADGTISATAFTPASPLIIDGLGGSDFDIIVIEFLSVKGVGGGESKLFARSNGVDLTAAAYSYRISDAVMNGGGYTELSGNLATTGWTSIYVDATGTSSYHLQMNSASLAETTTIDGAGTPVAGTGAVRRTIGAAYVASTIIDGLKLVPAGVSAGLKVRISGRVI